MTLDFSRERYVRIYLRDSADWLALSWDGQALLMQLLRKADRRGRLPLGRHGKKGVAILLQQVAIWESRISPALDELLADGCLQLDGETLFFRNFVAAQESVAHPTLRMADYRDRKREALKVDVSSTPGDVSSTDVDALLPPVTGGYPVLSRTVPSRALPYRTDQKAETRDAEKSASTPPVQAALTGIKTESPTTPAQKAARQAIASAFEAKHAQANTGVPFPWSAKEKKHVKLIATACGDDAERALTVLRAALSDPFLAEHFLPSAVSGQVAVLLRRKGEPPPVRVPAWVDAKKAADDEAVRKRAAGDAAINRSNEEHDKRDRELREEDARMQREGIEMSKPGWKPPPRQGEAKP